MSLNEVASLSECCFVDSPGGDVLSSQRCHSHCRIADAYRPALRIGSPRLQVSLSVQI
jgi:hypothetical protein